VDLPEFEACACECYPRIRRAALVMTGDPWEADDLAQETFLEAAKSCTRYAGRSRVETWLYAILLRLRSRRLRSKQRQRRRWLTWLDRSPPRPEPTAEARLLEEEWRRSLWAAVARLPEAQQHTVVLRFSEGLTHEEIAETMHCPIGTVKSRLHHALANLAERLPNDECGPRRESHRDCAATETR
jgi:RNA polymerase sigma-70 factor, ECF subfamily